MATNQAAFNALVTAITNNQSDYVNMINSDYSISNGQVNLRSQTLNNNDISQLSNALQNNISVKRLNLDRNPFGYTGVEALVNVLKNNKSMTFLELSLINSIGDEGGKIIATLLKNNNTLQGIGIGLGLVGIGDIGATAIAEALKTNTGLSLPPQGSYDGGLHLGYNNIGPIGAGALAEALKINKTLGVLYIQYNPLGDTGVLLLLDSLRFNTQLRNLWINKTQATNLSLANIVDIFNVNSSLQFIELAENSLDDQVANLWITALQKNKALTYIGLTSTSISQSYIDQIGVLLTRNYQYPQFQTNSIKIEQGKMITLTSDNLKATISNNSPLTFYIIETDHCVFCKATTHKGLTQFTPADILAEQVQFIHDGSAFAPSYSITASNGTLTTPEHKSAIIFTPTPTPTTTLPMLTKNRLRLNADDETLITPEQLLATLDGLTPSPGLIFNVRNVTGGHFAYKFDDLDTAIDHFYQGDMIWGIILFLPDGTGRTPSAQIQVSDGLKNSSWSLANISLVHTTSSSPFFGVPTVTKPSQPTPWLTFQPTPLNTTPQITSDRNTNSGTNTTAIALGILGGLVFTLIIIGAIFWWRSRRTPVPIPPRTPPPSPSSSTNSLRSMPSIRQVEPPDDYLCPICLQIMTADPVVDNHGDTYCKSCIEIVFSTGPRISPLNRQPITRLAPNRGLNGAIQHWLAENDPQGIRFPRAGAEI
jgi:hypothetical protein